MAVNFSCPASLQSRGVFYSYAVFMDTICATHL
jgi:hypothetical protein